MNSAFRPPKMGVQSNRRGRRWCSRSRWLVPIAFFEAVLGVVLVGCSGSSNGGGAPTDPAPAAAVPEVYPGVISPLDVGPQTAPAKNLDGRAMLRQPLQKKVEYLVGKYGADAVVALVVEGAPPDTQRQILQKVIRAADSNAETFTMGPDDRTVSYLAPVTDLERFAERLELGEVTLDSPKRVVLVKADAAKVAAEIPPRMTQLSSLPGRPKERPPGKPTWQLQSGKEFPPDSVLVAVNGVDPRIADALVEHVMRKNSTFDISRYEFPGHPCAFVCSGVADIESLGELLDIGTVMGVDKLDARVGIALDLGRVMKSAGPGAAARLDPNSLEWALEELKSPDYHVRLRALGRVQQTPPDEAFRGRVAEALKPLLGGDDHPRRRDAIRTLVAWGATEAVPDLIELLGDRYIFVRQEAICALGELNDERAIEPLCGLLGREREAELALIAMGPAVEDAVLASLDPANEDRFRAACKVLSGAGTKKSLEKLGPFVVSGSGALHDAASDAVRGIHRRPQESGMDAAPGSLFAGIDVLAGVLVNLKSGDESHVRHACNILIHAKPDPERRQEIARALVDIADHKDDFVRASVINALAVWYTPESVPKVIEITKDRRAHIRKVAIGILGQVGTKVAIEVILDRFNEDPFPCSDALEAIGLPAEDALLRRMESPPLLDKAMAYSLLGHYGSGKSLKRLQQVSSEWATLENMGRRQAALMALRWREQFYKEPPRDKSRAGEPATSSDAAAKPKSEPRTWTDDTGKFKIEAALLDLKDGQVTLKRTDGRIVSLPLERLNKADQNFIQRAMEKSAD